MAGVLCSALSLARWGRLRALVPFELGRVGHHGRLEPYFPQPDRFLDPLRLLAAREPGRHDLAAFLPRLTLEVLAWLALHPLADGGRLPEGHGGGRRRARHAQPAAAPHARTQPA
eukprot:scaffold101446_cov25-Tisochrysis_lutea.AAC.1